MAQLLLANNLKQFAACVLQLIVCVVTLMLMFPLVTNSDNGILPLAAHGNILSKIFSYKPRFHKESKEYNKKAWEVPSLWIFGKLPVFLPSVSSNTLTTSELTVSYFRSGHTNASVKLCRDLIQMFDLVMTRNGLDYILYGGSLIGSYRHHGIVPWDDDIDFLVPLSIKAATHKALASLGPQYTLGTHFTPGWKLFSTNAYNIKGRNWKWPFLDIFFYAENDTHIWDSTRIYSKDFVFPKNIVFPLKRRPFMGLQLLAPYNSRAVIDRNYDINACDTGHYDHQHEKNRPGKSVACTELYFMYPFVFRTFHNGGCNESLIEKGRVLDFYFEKDSKCDI